MTNEKRIGPRLPVYISVDDPRPMYAQVESQLRDLILEDSLEPGTRLPSARALAGDLTCSVITTRRVYKDLEDEGFIRTRSGRGTVVAQLTEEEKRIHLRRPFEEAVKETARAGWRAGLSEEEMLRTLEETLQNESPDDEGGTP